MKKFHVKFETVTRIGEAFLLADSSEEIEKAYCDKYLIREIEITEIVTEDKYHIYLPLNDCNI